MISAEASEFKAKPLRGRFASLDTSANAKRRQLRGGRGRSRKPQAGGSCANGLANETARDGGDATRDSRRLPVSCAAQRDARTRRRLGRRASYGS